MKIIALRIFTAFVLIIGITIIGCDKEENPAGPENGTGTGLFKTAGTFSFSSDKGNFSANGIFDTLFTSLNAAGAFQYTEDGISVVYVYAYDMRDTSNVQVVFVGIVDTLGSVTSGTYSFSQNSGSKMALFGYMRDITDMTNSSFYILATGSLNVNSVSTTTVSGSFSGNGMDLFDTTKVIAITNGSFNTPIVEKYFGYGRDDEQGLVQEQIQNAIRRKLLK